MAYRRYARKHILRIYFFKRCWEAPRVRDTFPKECHQCYPYYVVRPCVSPVGSGFCPGELAAFNLRRRRSYFDGGTGLDEVIFVFCARRYFVTLHVQ